MEFQIQVYTGGFAQTNGYLFEAPEGWVLVDAPAGVTAWLDGKGVKLAALLLTHQHYDHVTDVAALVAAHDCPVYAHSPLSRSLTLEDVLAGAGMPVTVKPYEVGHLLAGKETVSVAGLEFGVRYVPGHSTDSICFILKDQGLVFVGDTVFAGSIGRVDFPGGSMALLVEGIRSHLLRLPGGTQLLPGHGPATSVAEEAAKNPYLR